MTLKSAFAAALPGARRTVRADNASHTVAGDLQTSPFRIERKRLRFSVGVIVCSHWPSF